MIKPTFNNLHPDPSCINRDWQHATFNLLTGQTLCNLQQPDQQPTNLFPHSIHIQSKPHNRSPNFISLFILFGLDNIKFKFFSSERENQDGGEGLWEMGVFAKGSPPLPFRRFNFKIPFQKS